MSPFSDRLPPTEITRDGEEAPRDDIRERRLGGPDGADVHAKHGTGAGTARRGPDGQAASDG